MKLDIKALALAGGILWGAAVLFAALANLVWPEYGNAFLEMVASVYPGYAHGRSVAQVIVGGGYALLDGAVAGAVFASLYNWLCRR